MSLGSWFREYVYIPLGGNRVSYIKQYRNLFVVWLLTGLWHGASWNFIIWGLYFGLFVTLEKVFLLKLLNKTPKIVPHFYSLFVVIIGWVFFEFDNMTRGIIFLKTMFGLSNNKFMDSSASYYFTTNGVLFVILILCATPIVRNLTLKIREKTKLLGAIGTPIVYLVLLILSTAYLVNQSYNPFLYFRF